VKLIQNHIFTCRIHKKKISFAEKKIIFHLFAKNILRFHGAGRNALLSLSTLYSVFYLFEQSCRNRMHPGSEGLAKG